MAFNAYNNTGVEQKGTTIFASGSTSAPSLGQYADDPIGAMNSQKGNPATPDIVTVSKDFKYPQVFRVNLALERVLPGDVKMTLEGLYSKTFNNVYFENLALSSNAKVYAVPGVETSATPYYSVDKKYFSITNLKKYEYGIYLFSVRLVLKRASISVWTWLRLIRSGIPNRCMTEPLLWLIPTGNIIMR